MILKSFIRTSLVAQWIRIRLPMQGTRVRFLVWEDSTCYGTVKPVHNYWALALEPRSRNYWSPVSLEPMLHNKERHCHKQPTRSNEEEPLLAATRKTCTRINEDPAEPKIYKFHGWQIVLFFKKKNNNKTLHQTTRIVTLGRNHWKTMTNKKVRGKKILLSIHTYKYVT